MLCTCYSIVTPFHSENHHWKGFGGILAQQLTPNDENIYINSPLANLIGRKDNILPQLTPKQKRQWSINSFEFSNVFHSSCVDLLMKFCNRFGDWCCGNVSFIRKRKFTQSQDIIHLIRIWFWFWLYTTTVSYLKC